MPLTNDFGSTIFAITGVEALFLGAYYFQFLSFPVAALCGLGFLLITAVAGLYEQYERAQGLEGAHLEQVQQNAELQENLQMVLTTLTQTQAEKTTLQTQLNTVQHTLAEQHMSATGLQAQLTLLRNEKTELQNQLRTTSAAFKDTTVALGKEKDKNKLLRDKLPRLRDELEEKKTTLSVSETVLAGTQRVRDEAQNALQDKHEQVQILKNTVDNLEAKNQSLKEKFLAVERELRALQKTVLNTHDVWTEHDLEAGGVKVGATIASSIPAKLFTAAKSALGAATTQDAFAKHAAAAAVSNV